ncbi:four-helix bundle copper-binding protein [Comamonas sp.]
MCLACANECERHHHAHCQACAAACKQCAQACLKMVN